MEWARVLVFHADYTPLKATMLFQSAILNPPSPKALTRALKILLDSVQAQSCPDLSLS